MVCVGVASPNHSTPSCTIRQLRLAVPDPGATSDRSNVTRSPGATSLGSLMRFGPQVPASRGESKPRAKVAEVHIVDPEFSIVIWNVKVLPDVRFAGRSDWDTKVAH